MEAKEFDDAIDCAERIQRKAQFGMQHDVFVPAIIDEISLLFKDESDLAAFVDYAVHTRGMEHFNSVRDNMVRKDMAQQFVVAFEFLKFPESNWRIEAMCVLKGAAPLHKAHLMEYGNGCVVHASWKCEDVREYKGHKGMIQHERLQAPLPFIAEYSNTYGIFSYFKYGDYYLKPRVNLRDAHLKLVQ